MTVQQKELTRIAIFYDGNYFLHVSNYYNYHHFRRARLSISGLHDFIKHKVAQEEGTNIKMCRIVEAHYFRGRLPASEAKAQNKLYTDRLFDDVLMNEGVTTHYTPLKQGQNGNTFEEKGIDVWLALEAYERALLKDFDVLVLIASDGDYAPLVNKLTSRGIRVMVLSWDFAYTNENGKEMVTRTSQELLEEAPYPVPMHEIIDNRVHRNDPLINNLFIPGSVYPRSDEEGEEETMIGKTSKVNDGYGYISSDSGTLFFHQLDVVEGQFSDLKNGDPVKFVLGRNDKGQEVATKVRKVLGDEINDNGKWY